MYKNLDATEIKTKLEKIGYGRGATILKVFLEHDAKILGNMTDKEKLFEKLKSPPNYIAKFSQFSNNTSDIKKLYEAIELLYNQQTYPQEPFKTIYANKSKLSPRIPREVSEQIQSKLTDPSIYQKFRSKLKHVLEIARIEAFVVLVIEHLGKLDNSKELVGHTTDEKISNSIATRMAYGYMQEVSYKKHLDKLTQTANIGKTDEQFLVCSRDSNYVNNRKYLKIFGDCGDIKRTINKILWTWFIVEMEYVYGTQRHNELTDMYFDIFKNADFNKISLKVIKYNPIPSEKRTFTGKDAIDYLEKPHNKIIEEKETNFVIKSKMFTIFNPDESHTNEPIAPGSGWQIRSYDHQISRKWPLDIAKITLSIKLEYPEPPGVINDEEVEELNTLISKNKAKKSDKKTKIPAKLYRGLSSDNAFTLVNAYKEVTEHGFVSSVSESADGFRMYGQGMYWSVLELEALQFAFQKGNKYSMIMVAITNHPPLTSTDFNYAKMNFAETVMTDNDNYVISNQPYVLKGDDKQTLFHELSKISGCKPIIKNLEEEGKHAIAEKDQILLPLVF